MFKGCWSLTSAPELPATTLADYCYYYMFENCSNLNTITLGYTGNFADAPTYAFSGWVYGVASTGTFYYNGSDTTTGSSAIPTGWTVISPYGGLTITAREANSTVTMIKDSGAPSVTLEYSTDSATWNPFVVGTTTVTLNNVGDYVCFRAGSNGNTTFTTMYTLKCNKFVITGSVDLSGDLNSIINQDYDNVTTINSDGSGGIGCLFYNCSAIVDASKLLMKATTIGNFTYNHTFYGCSNMTKAPTIYATSVGSRYSFGDLFHGCSSLSEIKIYYTGNFGGERTSNWVSGVPSTGTFYYNGSDTTIGTSAIPSGWTVTPFTP